MAHITDTVDYERKFMEGYLQRRAKKKIEVLNAQLEKTDDMDERLEIKKSIRRVEMALETEIQKLSEPERSNEERVNADLKTSKLGDFSPDDFFLYSGFKIPSNIWNYLYDYQKTGVMWMLDIFTSKRGGVLADEMGLGKTIQVCAVIVSLFASSAAEQFLILCPVTVIDHWMKELAALHPCPKIHRVMSQTHKGVFIMSYESFRGCLVLPQFDCVFLDEGHKIKNKDSQIFAAVKKIDAISRFVVTGTPIQNNLCELWSIFDFVNPNLLGSYLTFNEEFERNIRGNRNTKEMQKSYSYSVMLRSIIEPFILRRMKTAISHILPEKLDKVVFVTLSEQQNEIYTRTLQSDRFVKLMRTGFKAKGSLLFLISYLRKICNHLLLVDQRSFEEYRQCETAKEGVRRLQTMPFDDLVRASCKMMAVFEFLDKWHAEKNRVLLFFQTVQMLEIMKAAIEEHRSTFKMLSMTGSTPMSQRSEIVSRFNDDPSFFVFLLTTRVGGLGLNLTGANRVIIYDPDWNPTTDTQAKERIYRYGQKTNVEIYRLVCRETIEEKIYQRQIYKDCLSKKILSNPEISFGKENLIELFTYHTSFEKNLDVQADQNFVVEDDQLVEVREEDRRDFSIMKNYNSKQVLTGEELIEFIKRRECCLDWD